MSYETLDDRMGIFDAKGIEVVRRDSPLLVSKVYFISITKPIHMPDLDDEEDACVDVQRDSGRRPEVSPIQTPPDRADPSD